MATNLYSQTGNSPLPYHQIPDYPDKYSATTTVARMLDGLGYRYYWATDSLRTEDLEYKPSEDSRSAGHTIEHIHGLSQTVLNAIQQKANVPTEPEELSFEETRKRTLENFKIASEILKNSKKKDLKKFDIVFKRGDKSSSFPFWNLLNGPIADAIYHTGQIVAYRRASGNPLNSKVSVFTGKNKE